MRTKEQYLAGLRRMRRNLYLNGEKIPRDHELQMLKQQDSAIPIYHSPDRVIKGGAQGLR